MSIRNLFYALTLFTLSTTTLCTDSTSTEKTTSLPFNGEKNICIVCNEGTIIVRAHDKQEVIVIEKTKGPKKEVARINTIYLTEPNLITIEGNHVNAPNTSVTYTVFVPANTEGIAYVKAGGPVVINIEHMEWFKVIQAGYVRFKSKSILNTSNPSFDANHPQLDTINT